MDPITLAVIKGSMDQIADEMDLTLVKSAFSQIISESLDRASGIYEAESGEMVVQGQRSLPIFIGGMQFSAKHVINDMRQRGIDPGDVYLVNDVYTGGTHLMDVKLFKPIFVGEGDLLCYLANTGHWMDIGGARPGGFTTQATDVFQEGLRLGPTKIFRRGELNEDVLDIILRNVRLPREAHGDLMAQLNALHVGEQRLRQLVSRYGPETIRAYIDELKERSERQMRSYLAEIPDGTYEFEDYLDNDGISNDPLRVALRMTVEGDSVHFDFSDSSPMTRGPFNVVQAVTISATYIAIKHIFTDVHINAGFFKPIRFTLPPTCFLNAQPPASCSAYTETSQRVIDVVFGALGKALPERLFGAPFSTISVITIAGQDAARGYYVAYMYFGGGFGGSRHSDGLNHANAPFGLALIPPLEVHEQRFPLLFHQFGLRPDSGGAGQHRGGLGGAYEFSFLGEEAHISLAGDRGKFPPFGVNGGKPGAKNEVTFTFNGDSAPPPLLTKADRLLIHQHDRVRVESPGGGGFGDPFERDPQLVLEDVRRGYVSVETARQAYGVEVDTANWKVDETATGELRNAGAEGES